MVNLCKIKAIIRTIAWLGHSPSCRKNSWLWVLTMDVSFSKPFSMSLRFQMDCSKGSKVIHFHLKWSRKWGLKWQLQSLMQMLSFDLERSRDDSFSGFRNPAPCGIKAFKHSAIKEGPSVTRGEGRRRGKKGEETVNGKAIIHFSLSFQALSHIKASQR